MKHAMAKPIPVTTDRMLVGRDVFGEKVWLETCLFASGRVSLQLRSGGQGGLRLEKRDGERRFEWVDLTDLQLRPFQPPDWWSDFSEGERYDAGDLCSVVPRDLIKRVAAIVVGPCLRRRNFYQVRQWNAERHTWGPARAISIGRMRRAWG